MDVAVRTSFPEIQSVVPHLNAEGLWQQPGGAARVSLERGSPPYIRLECNRGPRVTGTLKGVIVRAIFDEVDLTAPSEIEVLRGAGKRASESPDPKEPWPVLGGYLVSIGFLGVMTAVVVGMVVLGAFAFFVLPLLGRAEPQSAYTYWSWILMAVIGIMLVKMTLGERRNDLNGWRLWPPPDTDPRVEGSSLKRD